MNWMTDLHDERHVVAEVRDPFDIVSNREHGLSSKRPSLQAERSAESTSCSSNLILITC